MDGRVILQAPVNYNAGNLKIVPKAKDGQVCRIFNLHGQSFGAYKTCGDGNCLLHAFMQYVGFKVPSLNLRGVLVDSIVDRYTRAQLAECWSEISRTEVDKAWTATDKAFEEMKSKYIKLAKTDRVSLGPLEAFALGLLHGMSTAIWQMNPDGSVNLHSAYDNQNVSRTFHVLHVKGNHFESTDIPTSYFPFEKIKLYS